MTQQTGLLSDITVLDLSEGVSGPLCGKLLAGMGAEVIKVESPATGDESRRAGPFPKDDPHLETSGAYLYFNMGKKGITLDIETDTGASLLRKLVQDTDVLIESSRPGYMESRELGYADLEPLNPGLVYTSITPFGQTGPYRDYKGGDLVLQAVGALMHTIGLPEKEPIKVGGTAALSSVGMSAFSGTMLALYVRDVEGYGQLVDISAMQTVTVTQIHSSIHHQFGRIPTRRESALVEAADGWVNPGLELGVQEDTWKKVCDLMGLPELADNPAFNTREARRINQQDLLSIIGDWVSTQPKERIYHTLQNLRTIAGYVATVEDLRNSEQLQFREFFQTVDHPVAGEAVYPGIPFSIDDSPTTQSRAPLLGEHNVDIYCDRLGYSKQDLGKLRSLGIL
jgi:formyl-CoA transferase/CoA:oxalate CoA-transferase